MILEELTFDPKNNSFKALIDGNFFCLDYKTVEDLNLSTNKNITDEEFLCIIDNDRFNRAKIYSLNLLSHSAKSSSEISLKLKMKGYKEETITNVLNFLDNYHLIDEKSLCENYIKDKCDIKHFSKRKILYNLRMKKIDNKTIEKYIKYVNYDKELDNCRYFYEKKKNQKKDRRKIFNYLLYQGFDCDVINEILNEE